MFVMSNKVYEGLKKFVTIVLPAFSTFYIALAELWGLPASLQVAGTCSALAAFLGICLGISSSTYRKLDTEFDGNVVVNHNPDGGILYSLEPDVPVDAIQDMSELRLKVVPGQPPQDAQG